VKNLVLYLLFISAIVLAYGFTYSLNPADPAGKQVFMDKKCNSCHTVETAGVTSKKKDASDLSTTGDTYNADFLKKYLMKEEKIEDTAHKTAFKGTDQELDDLVKWIESLKAKK
jgi:cytochrome c553